MAIKIGINGLGRIARMIIRSIVESKNKKIEILPIVKTKTKIKVLLPQWSIMQIIILLKNLDFWLLSHKATIFKQ